LRYQEDRKLAFFRYRNGEWPNSSSTVLRLLYYPAEEFGFDIPAAHPNIAGWLDRIKALPGWKHPYDLMPGYPLQR
jgi:glutathione S-transferase